MTPPSVTYAITVTWPSEEQSVICQRELPLADAAERLEILADEIREAVKMNESKVRKTVDFTG